MPAAVASPTGYKASVDARTLRKRLYTQVGDIVSKAAKENRDMSSEELEKFNKLTEQVGNLDERISKLEKSEDSDTEEESSDSNEETDSGNSESDSGERNDVQIARRGERRTGVDADTRNNPNRRRGEERAELRRRDGESDQLFRIRERRSTREYFAAVRDYLIHGDKAFALHQRALQADVDIVGGYLVLPEQISERILKRVDNILWIRQVATVSRIENAQSLGIPSLDADPEDGDWTTEIAPIDADSAMAFGKRSLTPSPIRKRLLVSERFLRMAFAASFTSNDTANGQGGSAENIVINRLAYKIAATMENAYFTGNGVGRPLGIFTASSRGISTSRDVATGSTTGITYAGLVTARMTLKVQYHNAARWAVSRKFVEKVMQLVDNNGRPLLDFNTLPNQPTTLLQMPMMISEYTPNTFSSNAYVAVLGDFTYYYVVDSQDVTVKQADQLYAETGQIGFFISAESDGMPVLEEAFVRLKCST